MKRIYEKQWFGIEFSEFAELTTKRVAGADFYKAFYKRFYEKYSSYDELPDSWLKSKNAIVQHLKRIVDEGKNNVLSIGCGNGYVESRLLSELKENTNLRITAVEPSVHVKQWCLDPRVDFIPGFFPDAVEKEHFDFCYANAIDYVFNDCQYLEFLKSVGDFGIKDFLLTGISVQRKLLKILIRDSINRLLSLVNRYEYGQLWGYARTIEENLKILRRAGFRIRDVGNYEMGIFWIRVSHD